MLCIGLGQFPLIPTGAEHWPCCAEEFPSLGQEFWTQPLCRCHHQPEVPWYLGICCSALMKWVGTKHAKACGGSEELCWGQLPQEALSLLPCSLPASSLPACLLSFASTVGSALLWKYSPFASVCVGFVQSATYVREGYKKTFNI